MRLPTSVFLPLTRYFTTVCISWLGVCLCLFLITHQGEARCFGHSSCEAVLSSRFSHVWGIGLAYYGLTFYAFCFVISNLKVLRCGQASGHALSVICRIITALGFVVSVVLLSLQLFVIKAFCFYCMTSLVVCALLFLVALLPAPRTQLTAAPAVILLMVPLATLGGWVGGNSQTPDPLIYTIDGKSVRKSSLMPGLAVTLQPFNDAIYETTRQFAEEHTAAELVASEARKFGVDENAYLQRAASEELEPSDKEIEASFAPGPSPPRGSAFWKQAEQLLLQRRIFAVRETVARSLEAKHKVNILLEQPRPAKIDIDYRYVFTDGPASAPTHLIVFSDFECPYCATVAGSLRRMRARYGNLLQIGFWNVPLVIHEHARIAAAGSLCAEKQGLFWQYHDKIFSLQSLTAQDVTNIASRLSLNMPAFKACLTDSKTAAAVEESYDAARKLGVDSTPSLFLNGQLIGGVLSDEQLAEKIRSILKERGF